MAEPLIQQLELDISAALASIGQLDDALQSVVTNFSGQLNAALADLQAATVTVDTSALTSDVESAIGAVSTPVPVEGDVSGLESDIASAAAQPLDITADTTGLQSDITTAIGDANTVVPVEGDTTGLASDIASASSQPVELNIDTGAVTGDITAAIADVSAPVAVEGDTSALDSAIADALDQPRPPLLVEGDTTELTDAIDSATTGLSTTLPVDGDTSALSESIDSATSIAPTIPVDADITAAKDAIDSLTVEPIEQVITADTSQAQDAIDQLGSSAASAGSGVDSLSGGVETLKGVTGLAQGELDSFEGVISNIAPGAAEATAGLAAFAAFVGSSTALAADAQAQNKRFADTFGTLANAVKQVNVGGLNVSLADLGKESGTTEADLLAVASRIGLLGQSAGASAGNIVKTTDNLLALGATISVNNPRLGDAAEVTDKLTAAFARGGRALAPFGIALSSAQINAEALKETGKATAAELTIFEKATAGSNLALEKFGNTLGTQFQAGAANAQVQLRALKVQIEETLAKVGGPLLKPLVDSLTALTPVAQTTAEVLGAFARLTFPWIVILARDIQGVTPALQGLADVMNLVADIENRLLGPTQELGSSLNGISAPATTASTVVGAFQNSLLTLVPGLGQGVSALQGLGAAIGLFHHHAAEAKVDTASLDEAFATFADSGDKGTASIGALTTSVEGFLKSSLALGDIGKRGSDATNLLGLSLHELSGALLGTNAQFDDFITKIDDSAANTGKNKAAFTALTNTLKQSRTEAEAQAKETLISAAAQGTLTKAQVQAALEQAALSGDAKDYLAVLKELTPQIDRNAHAQQNTTDANFAGTQGAKDLQAAIADGTVTLSGAAAAATQYGISQDEATQIITDSITAHDQAAASAILHSQAYAQLVRQVAAGEVTIPDAIAEFHAMGLSMDGATAAASSLESTVTSALKSIDGALPSTSDAANQWQKDISDAFAQAENDAKNHTGNITQDLATLAADQDPQKFADNLNKQTISVLTFQDNLATLLKRGQQVAAQTVVQIAQSGNFDLAAQLAKSMVSSPSGAKIDEAAVTVGGHAVTSLNNFLSRHANEVGLQFGAQVAPGIIDSAPAIDGAVTQLTGRVNQRFRASLSLDTNIATVKAAQALAADPTISQAAGQKGLEAVEHFRGPLTFDQAIALALKVAHQRLQDDPTLAVGAAQKGKQTGDAYKPDLSQGAKKALDDATVTIRAFTGMFQAAGTAGVAVGSAFDAGIAQGLASHSGEVTQAATNTVNAAIAAAKAAAGVKSPSTVAIGIGQDVVRGLVIGLTDTATVSKAGAGLALAITASSGLAFADAGRTAVNQIVAGFNDPATVAAAIATLQQLVAQATATASGTGAATTQFSSFVSSVISQLPAGASAISNFGQTISSDLSTQASALDGVHKAYTAYHEDLAKSRHRAHDAGIAYGALIAAQTRLNAAVAAHAPKNVIAELTDSLKAAQSNLDSLSNKLDSARSRVSSDQSNIADSTKQLHEASRQLALDTNPATFVKNLNAQTAANREFQRNIAKLAHEGFTDLAQQLAAAGPETAGKLAKGLASKRALAKSAEAAIAHAKAFSDSFEAFLTKVFGPKVAATVATVGQHAGNVIGSDLIAITDTATQHAVTNVNAQLSAVAPEIRVTVDTTSVTTGLDQLPTSAPLTVVPTLGHLAIPPFPAVTLPVTPDIAPIAPPAPLTVEVVPHVDPLAPATLAVTPVLGPVPPLPSLTVAVNADVAPIAPQTVEVRPDLDPPLPQFAPMRLDVIPDLGPLPSTSLSVEPVLDPLPALAPISVRVIPVLDALPPGLTASLQPHLSPVGPAAAPVAPAPTSQTLELDLAITIPDGTVLTATKTVTVPINRSATKTKIGAAVQAKVRA